MDSWNYLLRLHGARSARDDEPALLGQLLYFAHYLGRGLHLDSSLASHCGGELGTGDASVGNSGHDRRSCGADSFIDFYAEAARDIRREIWSVPIRDVRGGARDGGSGYVAGALEVVTKLSSEGFRKAQLLALTHPGFGIVVVAAMLLGGETKGFR